jgi:hypothetical protein
MKEIWKYHPETSNYMISSLGNAKSFTRNPDGKLMKKNIGDCGYVRHTFIINGISKTTRVHRLVAELFIEDFDKTKIVDHINRNRTDNNINNLRLVLPSGNSMNSTGTKKGSSKYKGVYLSSKSNKWIAEIMRNKKHYVIGSFFNEKDAAKAYDKKCILLHGMYAVTNKNLGLLD